MTRGQACAVTRRSVLRLLIAAYRLALILWPSFALAQTGSVVTVNSDNVLVINGRKVFPIGFSPGPPINGKTPIGDDAMQEFRDAGALLFRMVQTTDWNSQLIATQQAALDWAAQHGMYIWLNLRELSEFNTGDTATAASLRSLVDTFKDHPGLGLWKNYDEAWWGGITVTQLLNGYNVIKQEDTNHPVVQTHAPRGTVSDLQPYNVAADVLAVYIYPAASPPPSNPPLTNTNISVVGDWTQVIEQVANGQKQHWTIEQIAFSGTTPPSHPLLFPTFTQSRYLAYQAINYGARALMFYGGNVAATLTNATDAALQWNWTFWTNVLKSVVQQLGDHGQLATALVTTNSTLPITISGTTVPDLEYVVREVPPYLYILATKREGTNATVTFNGLPSWATNAEVLYESPRTIAASGGQFSDLFAPFDVLVYRFAQRRAINRPQFFTPRRAAATRPARRSRSPFSPTAQGPSPTVGARAALIFRMGETSPARPFPPSDWPTFLLPIPAATPPWSPGPAVGPAPWLSSWSPICRRKFSPRRKAARTSPA